MGSVDTERNGCGRVVYGHLPLTCWSQICGFDIANSVILRLSILCCGLRAAMADQHPTSLHLENRLRSENESLPSVEDSEPATPNGRRSAPTAHY